MNIEKIKKCILLFEKTKATKIEKIEKDESIDEKFRFLQ